MNKNLNHKGASKRKGAAESKELTEDGPVIDVADKGMAKKKGAAQVGYDAIINYGKDIKKIKDKADAKLNNDEFAAGIYDSINMANRGDINEKGDNKALATYGANYGQYGTDDGKGNRQDYLGEKSFVEPSSSAMTTYMNTTMDEIKDNLKAKGANRMGFTQNFGAARQNGYAKGAAKVNSIMNFGAAKAKGAAQYGGKKGDDSKSKKDYEG